MSTYQFKAVNKKTGAEMWVWAMDDHFGRHRYGYILSGNDHVLTEEEFNGEYERAKETV